MTKRNANIDFWKFIFSVLIVFHHSIYLRSDVWFFLHGAIGVEFFFIVSGYLMVDSFERRGSSGNIARDTFDFMKRKASPLFSAVLASGLIGIFVKNIIFHPTAKEWGKLLAKNLPYFLMINYSGIREVPANGVTWYLSVMLLSMLVLYPIMHKNKELFLIVTSPVVLLFAFGYLYRNFDKPMYYNPHTWLGFCYKGMIRGVAEICLGAVCYAFAKRLRECRLNSTGRTFFSVVENLCYIVVLYKACTGISGKYEYILILLLAIAVSCSFSGQTARYPFPDKTSALANFGFHLYLGNFFWATSLGSIFPTIDYWPLFMVYLACTVVTAFLIRFGSKLAERVYEAGVNILIASEEPVVPLGGGG